MSLAGQRPHYPTRGAATECQFLRSPSVGTVTSQDAVHHRAGDKRNAIARASGVAMAAAAVVPLSAVPRFATIAAPVSGNITATRVAGR